MRLLLDTHIAIWALVDDPRLSARARELIEDTGNEILVSVASLWEIAIKHALSRKGENAMQLSAAKARDSLALSGYHFLGVQADHAVAVGELPPHHADPFDRILLAQAKAEPLRLVTHDARLGAYGDMVILV